MESPLRYKKRTGFATTAGQQLEVNLAALLYLRGLNSGLDFQLGTNVDGAGALDDVVFRFKAPGDATWTTLYVQLKFKANRPVQRAMLTNPHGDFSVPKYFESYRKIRRSVSGGVNGSLLDGSFEESVFIVFTNAEAGGSLGQECRGASFPGKAFIWSGTGNVFSFEDDEHILECLCDGGDEGNAFLGRLRLFCGQPDAKRLEAAIEKELRKVDSEITQGVDCERLFNCFLRDMKVWWETSNAVLHKGNHLLGAVVLEAFSQQTDTKYSLNLEFEKTALAGLRDSMAGSHNVFNIKSSENSCRLSLTKLCQAFAGQSLVLDPEGLLANKDALLVLWRKGKARCLIICTNGWTPLHQLDYFNVIKDLLAFRDTSPVVFVSNHGRRAAEALTGQLREALRRCEDDFLFSQLKEASQEKVLATAVSLQGHLTTLRKWLNDSPGGADRVLDACSVVEILERDGDLTLGSAFDEGIGFYVDRHLVQTTVVKDTVFQDGALRESVTVRVMQCASSTDFGLDNANVGGSAGFPWANRTGLFAKAVSFLSSLNDSTSHHGVSTGQIVGNLSNSQLVAEKDNVEVFIGPEIALGLFMCWPIGLRFGQQDAVTALWVRSSHSTQSGFLFVSDKTSEHDARKLSDFHKSKHWLSLKDGRLRWVRSQGDIEAIRRHVDRDQVSTFAPENAMDVEDRLVLVCAEPGMGKSTLMARLAKKTKEAHPRHFVFLVALNDHYQLFAQGKHKDVLGFLCSASKIESPLHRSLLKFALEVSGDVVVLLDGYDEIAPKYVEQSCDLMSRLIDETKASKIWMTSRNSINATLEAKIFKFAVALRKFSEMDQQSFLKKFWAEKSKLSEAELAGFVMRVVEKTSEAVGDKEKNFLGIPLQTQMLAEVYADQVTGSAEMSELPDRLDLLVLMDQFVDKKFRVYVEAKLMTSPDSPNYEDLLESFRESYMESHSNAGLILILGDDVIGAHGLEPIINISKKCFAEMKRGVDKTGFIDSIVDDKPRFVHRVFAEYFVAKWFSKHFAAHRELVESKMFTADLAVVRNLFDRMLAKGHDLHTAVINEDLEEVRTLLAREDVDVDAKDGGGRTALHLAASFGTSEYHQDNNKRGEILDLLIGKTSDFHQVDNVLGGSPLRCADVTRTWVAFDRFKPCTNNERFASALNDVTDQDMLDTVMNVDLQNLMVFCLDNGLDVEYCSDGKGRLLSRACEQGSLKVVSILLAKNADAIAVDNKRESPLHKASQNGHIEVVNRLLRHVIATFGDAQGRKLTESQQEQLTNYINIEQEVGRTAIHVAARHGHSRIISILIGQGGNPRSRDNYSNTPLHLAAVLKQPDAVRVLLEALDETGRADAVHSTGSTGYSVLMHGALGGCVECVALIAKAGGKMTQVDSDGFTPLMIAAQADNQEVVSYLLDNFNAEREGMDLQDYINMRQKIGWTAVHFASLNNNPLVISTLIGQGGDPLSRDHSNSTPLHLAVFLRHPGAVRVILETLDEAGRADAARLVDNEGNDVLLYAAAGGCVDCVGLIVEAGGMLTHVGADGLTSLMAAGQKGHQEVVSYLLDNFNAQREGMGQQDYVNMTQMNGRTAINCAALNGYSEVISTLIGHGGDPRRGDDHNTTPLHIAAYFKHPGAVRVLLEALDEAGRADAVSLVDNDGFSVLLYAALGGCVQCVELIVMAGGKLTQVDNDGLTPLMTAALEGHEEAVSYLLNNFNAQREGMGLQDYINMTQKNGGTAIHCAARNGHSEVVVRLIGHGGDPLSRDNQNSTPLHIAAKYKHADALRVLLEALDEADRADAVHFEQNGNSVLMLAAFGGCVECVGLIVKAGGKMTQVDDDGLTPLVIAAQEGHHEVVRYLLNNFNEEREGVSLLDFINMTQNLGLTAIHFAAWNGHSQIISTLIGQGGDPRRRDHYDKTPLDLAVGLKQPEAVRVLLDAVPLADDDGDRVLMRAALGGCVECVGQIVEAGGRMTQVCADGLTPLMAAAIKGHSSVVEFLLDEFDTVREGITKQAYINALDESGNSALDLASSECRDILEAFLNSLVE